MPKLTVMKYNQMMMTALNINPYSFASPSLNWLQSLSSFFISISLIMCAALAALYAYNETYLPMILEAVGMVMGATASLSAYLNMRWKMDSVGQVNFYLQEIVDQGGGQY